MPYGKYSNTIISERQLSLLGVTVEVYPAGLTTYATIYSDINGYNQIAQASTPIQTDANGYFEFYGENGYYDLKISIPGFNTYHETGVEIIFNLPIYPSGAWVIDVTWQELLDKISASDLILGQKYIITDRENAIVEGTSSTTYTSFFDCISTMNQSRGNDISNVEYEIVNDQWVYRDLRYCDTISMTADSSDITITEFVNFNNNHAVIFQNQVPNSIIRMQGTPIADIVADGTFLWNGEVILDGNVGDSVTLWRCPVTNSHGSFIALKAIDQAIY